MTELTDLEICKKIAEIEGFQFTYDRNGLPYILKMWAECKEHPLPTRYNPLVDKALCFDLMNKYAIIYLPLTEGAVARWGEGEDDELSDKNPQRAVCLAIIKQHEAENGKQAMQTVQD